MNEDKQVEILLIEDNMHDAEMTMRALKRNHLSNHLIHLENGASALDFLFGKGEYEGRNIMARPKVILLDLKMPKIDGIEVLQKIKAHDHTRDIPVVVLTSSKENPDVQRCYDYGANSYIVKPVDFENFSKVVADLGMYWVLLNQPPIQ